MQNSGKMAQDGFGWPLWGGMSFSLWNFMFIYWLMLLGPGASLSKVVGATVLVISFAVASYGFVLFTRIRNIVIHKVLAFTTVALISITMIVAMLSDAWSLEKALGVG